MFSPFAREIGLRGVGVGDEVTRNELSLTVEGIGTLILGSTMLAIVAVVVVVMC